MPNLRTGTFLRIIGMDLVKRKGAFEVEILPIALPTGLDAAINALGAVQYGATCPSIMTYAGYELIIGEDKGADVSGSNGDTTKVWQTAYTGAGRLPDKINIPGRDTADTSLTLPGSENKINTAATPWQAFAAALADAHLKAPYNGTTNEPFIGGIATVSKRVAPREVVREVPTPIVIGGTRLKLYGVDNRGVVAASEFFILPVAVLTAVITAIDALAATIYGAVAGTTPLPSFMTYVGWELIVSSDAGALSTGYGDSRAKWKVVSNTASGADLRFTIPGRNDQVSSLFQTGSYTLANFGGIYWSAWINAMLDAHLTAPMTQFGGTTQLIGAVASNRPGGNPRENVS